MINKRASLEKQLKIAQRSLEKLETRASGHTSLSMPVSLEIELEDKRAEVARLEAQLENYPAPLKTPAMPEKPLEKSILVPFLGMIVFLILIFVGSHLLEIVIPPTTPTGTIEATLTLTSSPTPTPTSSSTPTPTSSPTPTPTSSPTPDIPDYTIRPYNIDQIVQVKRFIANNRSRVNSIVFGEENCLISAASNATIKFWPTGDEVFNPWNINAITTLSLENTQNLLAIGGNRFEIVLLDLNSMHTKSLITDDFTVNLSFDESGKWLAVSNGTHIQIWDTKKWEIYSTIPHYEWGSLQFNKTGDMLVTGSLNIYTNSSIRNVSVWRITPNQSELLCKIEDSKKASSVAFSPDGSQIVYGDTTGKIYFANANNCQLIDFFSVNSDSARISALTFNSSGDLLLSGASDGTIHIWPLNQFSNLQTQHLEAHESTIKGIIFDQEEQIIASGSIDGRVILWGLPRSEDIFAEMSCSYPSIP